MDAMTITVPQTQLRTAARTLTDFTGPVAMSGALAAAGLLETVAAEMVLLADTQATFGLHANAVNLCRVETCLENLQAVAMVLAEDRFSGSTDTIDDVRTVLYSLHDELTDYDEELKAA